MYFVFNKSHMFVRLNLVANLMYIIYVNNTLPLATDLYMKLHTELGRLCFDEDDIVLNLQACPTLHGWLVMKRSLYFNIWQ